ncbi:DUF3810 family protein [Pedobacter sp. HMF7647]|uniref:DUF3810 family protein n=1 Tax=Hufsiella arboris TaxID=2695275 RepID=A0A7K1Y6W5_9SPHI|nr:DUF3810 domain-containing protein [Hufsiella arboris]MXV50180.1 DUF3810 family protein [Hufsiella arboris]
MMSTKKKGIFALTFLILIIVIPFLRFIPDIVEDIYSQIIYLVPAYFFQYALGWIPFSIGDIFYALLVLAFILTLVRLLIMLFKKQWKRGLKLLLNCLLTFETLILLFYFSWGFNYFREPASVRLNLTDTAYTQNDLELVTGKLIDSTNLYRSKLKKADFDKSDEEMFSVAKMAVNELSRKSPVYKIYHPAIKKSLFTPLLNYMATSGYFNPFTGEAQLNFEMPVFLKPFVACHEMSHQSGFNREDEANFAGFVAGIHSDDRLLKYSSYYVGVQEFMFEIRRRDTLVYKDLRNRISPAVMADFKTDYDYWTRYQGDVTRFSGIFYDHFLKANNQKEGLKTYNRMIKLVMAAELKQRRNTAF